MINFFIAVFATRSITSLLSIVRGTGAKIRIEAMGITTRPEMEKLLVTMTGHDPLEKLMPCLEMLAKPRMTVIFVFPYPIDSRSYFQDHRITVESAIHATAIGRKVVARYNWDAQKELAQRIIAPAVDVLQNKGVEVEIHLCAGSLAKVIRNYSVDKDIHWIISQFPRPGLAGYLSAKSLVPSGWSSHLLSVRADRDPSGRQRQETLPARHRYPVSVWCSGQRVPVSASERKGNNDS
jgi:hypothetical protein